MVRREAGLVLYEIGHHRIRGFHGLDMSAPRLTGTLIAVELLCVSSKSKTRDNIVSIRRLLICRCSCSIIAPCILHVFIHRLSLGGTVVLI